MPATLCVNGVWSYKDGDGVLHVFLPDYDTTAYRAVERKDVAMIATQDEIAEAYRLLLAGELEAGHCPFFRLGAGLMMIFGQWVLMALRPLTVKLRPGYLDTFNGVVESHEGLISTLFTEGEEVIVGTPAGIICPNIAGFESDSRRLEAAIMRSGTRAIKTLGLDQPLTPLRVPATPLSGLPCRLHIGGREIPCGVFCESENRALDFVMGIEVNDPGYRHKLIDTEGFEVDGIWRPSDADSPQDPKGGRFSLEVNRTSGQCLLFHRGTMIEKGDWNKVSQTIHGIAGKVKMNNKVWGMLASRKPMTPGLEFIETVDHE